MHVTYASLATEAGIDRQPMNQKQYEDEFGRLPEEKRVTIRKHLSKGVRSCCSPLSGCSAFLSWITHLIPIISWLPSYPFRSHILPDVIGGLTTGIMHVPQGLAYSVLAGVDPVYGLYSSCFPAFFYMIFGTSRHASLGSFAVVTLMAGIANDQVRDAYMTRATTNGTLLDLLPIDEDIHRAPSAIQAAAGITFSIGLLQLISGVLRLEFLSAYFSDPLVSGFTTGAAVHVLVAQIDDIFGVKVPKVSGAFYLFKRLRDISVLVAQDCNWTCVIISVIAMTFLYCGKEYLTPFIKKRLKISLTIPFELILIIISTVVSNLMELNENYNVPIVGHIPTGVPMPSLPRLDIMPDCLINSLPITIVTIAVHISMAKMLAKKLSYSVDSRQELYALGLSSILGSLFSSYAVSTALGRTMVNVTAGTRTQLSTVFSCALLLVIIFWLGSLLRALPMCILASIIVVALKGMFQRSKELQELAKISRTDLVVWLIAFFSTACINVIDGLAISILTALLTVIFRSQWPKWEHVMGSLPANGEGSGDSDNSMASYRPSVAVFRFDAPLLFTNVERFESKTKRTLDEWANLIAPSTIRLVVREESSGLEQIAEMEKESTGYSPRFFILDCSSIPYIDYMGVKAITDLTNHLKTIGVTFYLAAINGDLRRSLNARQVLQKVGEEHLFPTLHDALSIAERNLSAAVMLESARDYRLRLDSPQGVSSSPLPPPITPTEELLRPVALSSLPEEKRIPHV